MISCENCGRPASVFYHVTVNGRQSELHLCRECAEKKGMLGTASLFPSLYDDESLFVLPLLSRAGRRHGETADRTQEAQAGGAQDNASHLPEHDAPSLATLKAQLKRAVRQEDFLRAAELRDRIRALERGTDA